MFDNSRYITKAASVEIPELLQLMMWQMIDNLREQGEGLDYLQVFRLTDEAGRQKIAHSQEVPEYKNEVFLMYSPPVTEKVFVIDDGEHSTMMLASDY